MPSRPAQAATAAPAPMPPLTRRPAEPRFTSRAVEETIARIRALTGPRGRLGEMFEKCFPNTLDSTVDFGLLDGRPDTFVITGDIAAMWLRDSSAQVWPYLTLATKDAMLRQLLAGVINRQTKCILIDPYANAFNKDPTGSPFAGDQTVMKPEIHERKWELDSLCYTVRLAHGYWRRTKDASCFDAAWRQASHLILDTLRAQQRKSGDGPYSFERVTGWNPDSVPRQGLGNPIRPVGLIVSIFRPSDDAAIFPFLVASNFFAVASLRQLAEMHAVLFSDQRFVAQCRALADEVETALRRYAVVDHPRHGAVYAYEVDGYGNRLCIDDANVPNLLSLPYLGCCAAGDPVYRATRALVLSQDNPWFFQGSAAEGLGSPHSPAGRIWPMGLIMRALTSNDDSEILGCLRMLARTDDGTGFMHEAFDKDDASKYTRPWFAWANSLFGELVLKLSEKRPALLRGV
ncbi:MAG: glycoside hydrolase family 125 protein [Alphaproteobacteria bacterium]|nr:glycoside hydrolase family 125 protein [Alphaproteobacteria bacterium]